MAQASAVYYTMQFMLHAIQSIYYWSCAKAVRNLGGVRGFSRIEHLSKWLGKVRSRIGYVISKPQDYLEEISRCFPQMSVNERRTLLQEFWYEHQRRFLELFIIPELDADNLDSIVSFNNLEELERLYQLGRGVILPVPHFGNVRLHHIALALKGYSISVVSGDYHMEPKYVQQMKLDPESRIHRVGFLSQGTGWMIEALRRGDLLQIASTAEASNQGVWINLLGRPFYFPTGWLRLARLTDAPVLPTINYRLPDGRYVIKILPELPLRWGSDRQEDLTYNAQNLMDIFNSYYKFKPEMVDWMYWLVRCREVEAQLHSNKSNESKKGQVRN